ncbi:MAG TPA: VOC family protein [Methyloceanibacter sp.]|nr:VOC family protein [Methyloceanibacter sp.]
MRGREGRARELCWNELITHDPAGARKFYADTIGWTFDAMPMQDGGTYWVGQGRRQDGGWHLRDEGPDFAGVPENWMPYLAVDDVDARVKKATRAGATLMRPLFDIPGIGRIAILRQPGGAGVGWMTPVTA